MTHLLDTHAFLWWVEGDRKLSTKARNAIAKHACALSLASVWEMSIKASLGKLKLAVPVGKFVRDHSRANGFDILSIDLEHLERVEKLPLHHSDPFDRVLIAQAMTEGLTIVSADENFANYDVKTIW